MQYIRSRPWRSRGPWFSNRAGARRRGRRNDEVMFTSVGDVTDGFGDDFAVAIATETHESMPEDVLLPAETSWPPQEQMLAIAPGKDHLIALTAGQSTAAPTPHWFDRIADEVVASHVLSQQRDDDATASRQSA